MKQLDKNAIPNPPEEPKTITVTFRDPNTGKLLTGEEKKDNAETHTQDSPRTQD